MVARLGRSPAAQLKFIRSESPLMIDGIRIPMSTSICGVAVVIVAIGPDDLKSLKPFIKEYQPVLVGVGTARTCCAGLGYLTLIVGDPDQISTRCSSAVPRCVAADADGRAQAWKRIRISVSAP